MIRLLLLGSLAAAFFSSTFVLNRAMSLEGGHWLWTASLRFGYMLVFLVLLVLGRSGRTMCVEVSRTLFRYWRFWILAGGIGFGVFYALICFSSVYAAGWIVAATWQTTILATPVILVWFGKKVPLKGILLILLMFAGILLVNIEHANASSVHEMLLSALPIVIAAFAYPLGNQMVWEAKQGGGKWIPDIRDAVLDDSFARVLLLTLGSLPFWLLLLVVLHPPLPSQGQLISTAMVALFSGVIATTVFLKARHLARNSHEIAAVDATQSLEVIFSLFGEIFFLHGSLPSPLGAVGIGMTLVGLILYTRLQNQ